LIAARRCSLRRGGIFFWTLVGFLHRACRKQYCGSGLIRFKPMVGIAMDQSERIDQSNAATFRNGRRARSMENHFPQSIASALSNQSAKLFVWPNQDSVSSVHALDHDWPCPRAFLVHLPGHPRTTWA